MADDTADLRKHKVQVVAFEMAELAAVVRGCAEILLTRDEESKRMGAILQRAAEDLWRLRRRLYPPEAPPSA